MLQYCINFNNILFTYQKVFEQLHNIYLLIQEVFFCNCILLYPHVLNYIKMTKILIYYKFQLFY